MAEKRQSTLLGLWKKPSTADSVEIKDSNVEEENSDDTDQPVSIKTKTKKKVFQENWLSQFNWLRYDRDKNTMHCTVCEKIELHLPSKSAFVKGTTNYQKSTLTRHGNCDDHILALKNITERRYMAAAKKCVNQQLEPIIEVQLRTALWMAKENIADRKFLSMIDLQIANTHLLGRDDSKTAVTERPRGVRTNHQAASDFQSNIASVLKDMMVVRLQNSPYIGIMLDESLDIATKKKLEIFARIIHDGSVRNEFCANVEVLDGKAETIYNTLLEFLTSVGIDMNKVSGFGTDGAAVMTGRRSGVGIRLQENNPKIVHVWCAAHKLALVSYWAAKRVPYLQCLQRTLVNIYLFYEFSAPRYNKLRELCRVMGEKVKNFKKPTQVRWLSMQDAVLAVHAGWSALVLGLEHEVASNPQSVGGNQAKCLLKECRNFKFICTISLLKDVLEVLCKLSKQFQKEVIDIEQITSLITSAKETLSTYQDADHDPPSVSFLIDCLEESDQYQGIVMTCSLRDRLTFANMKKLFLRNINDEFEKRFSEDDMKILKDLNCILNPKLLPEHRREIADYGLQYLDFICDYFSDIINSQQARNSYLPFKFLMNQNKEKSLLDFCSLIASQYKDEFPDFCTLASILATIPLTSVPCERGFSVQNRHLDRFTNRRSIQHVENRMFIAYAAQQGDFDENEVIRLAASKMTN